MQKVLTSIVEHRDRMFFRLLYGTGMRLMEGLRLRVKDIDFSYMQEMSRKATEKSIYRTL